MILVSGCDNTQIASTCEEYCFDNVTAYRYMSDKGEEDYIEGYSKLRCDKCINNSYDLEQKRFI